MLPILAFLLLKASSVLTSDHRGDVPYDGSLYSTDTYPIDYNDDFRLPPNQNSNIFFSFEQIRRDKTSQVDVREEDVGRYMNRPRIITTTRAPALVESREPDILPDVYKSPVRVNHWVDLSTTMIPPPPAPSPKWNGFDLDFRHSPFSQYKPEQRTYEYVTKPQPETAEPPLSQSSEAYREPYVNQDRASEETTVFTTTTVQPRMRSKVNSRGSYKFNSRQPVGSAEHTHPLQPPEARSPAPPAKRKPPPPVPTLTPWAGDNF